MGIMDYSLLLGIQDPNIAYASGEESVYTTASRIDSKPGAGSESVSSGPHMGLSGIRGDSAGGGGGGGSITKDASGSAKQGSRMSRRRGSFTPRAHVNVRASKRNLFRSGQSGDEQGAMSTSSGARVGAG